MSRGFQPVYTPAPRSGPPVWLLGLIGLSVIVIVSAVVFVLLSGNSPAPTPTTVAATSTPTAGPTGSLPPTAGTSASPGVSASPTGSPSESGTPGPTVDPALAALIDAVIAQVPPIRQLDATSSVPYQFISRDQFRDDLIELNDEDVPPEVRAAEERLLKRLGLLPDDADLNALVLELLGGQVAAYYRPDNGQFFIVQRDAPFGPLDKIVTAHEYTHALQDQHFDLEGTRITDLSEGDALLAQLAVIEGDATLTSQFWAIDNLTSAELLQVLSESLAGLDEQTLAGMPLVLRRQLEFPYTEGFLFVNEINTLGGFEAVDQAITTPPASTEQILHSQKYFDGEAPVHVEAADLLAALGNGWSAAYEQTMGELMVQILATGGEEPAVNIPGLPVEWPHAEAAAGWGGDRLRMYENTDGRWLIEWHTVWDTAADADEFNSRMRELAPTFGGPLVFQGVGLESRVIVASDDATLFLVPGFPSLV